MAKRKSGVEEAATREELANIASAYRGVPVSPDRTLPGANAEAPQTKDPLLDVVKKAMARRNAEQGIASAAPRPIIPDAPAEPVVDKAAGLGPGIDHSGWDWEKYPDGPGFNPPTHPGWLNKRR